MISVSISTRLDSFALDVAFDSNARIVALFGASGAGKSMTIGAIAGLVRPERARIALDGRVLVDTDRRVSVPRHRRRVGLVFQDAQLFPHLSVRQNLNYGRWFAPRDEKGVPFDQVVSTLGIGDLLARRPSTLSGGERQRVAIGRALLAAPRVLLMDEPLASLDEPRKREIMPLIARVAAEFATPILYVSHAVDEVARLAGDVVVLDRGRVVARGTPDDVFAAMKLASGDPRLPRLSLLSGKVAERDEAYGLTRIAHSSGAIWLTGLLDVGTEARVAIRATDVALALARPSQHSVRTVLEGKVETIESDGPSASVTLTLKGDGKLVASLTRKSADELGLAPGKDVFALVKSVALSA
jgi:molybdate transport system ATP-binding protein